MKHQRSGSLLAIVLSLIIMASFVHATTLPTTITPDNLVLRDQYGNIIATSLTVALINNTDGYVQLARALTESGTVFPSTPAVGYLYYRTDLESLYVYTGLQWATAMTATLPPGAISYNDLSDKPNLTVFLLENGTNSLTADWNVGSYGIYGLTILNSTAISANLYYVNNNLVIDSSRNGWFVNVNGTWINSTSLSFLGQFWYNGLNRTDLVAHPQDSYNFLVYTEGGIVYAKTGNTAQIAVSTIQACIDAVTPFPGGGSIIVKNGTYSEAVVVKNATRLVIDKGALGVTFTVAALATCIIEDYNTCINWFYSVGVLVMQYNNVNGAVNGIYSTFTNYYLGSGNLLGFVQPATFIIDVSGSTYQAWYGANSTFAFSSSNASAVINNAVGNVSGTVKETIVLKGSFELYRQGTCKGIPYCILINKDSVVLDLRQAKLTQADYQNATMILVDDPAVQNATSYGQAIEDVEILGGFIDGHKTHQTSIGNGIMFNYTRRSLIRDTWIQNAEEDNLAIYGYYSGTTARFSVENEFDNLRLYYSGGRGLYQFNSADNRFLEFYIQESEKEGAYIYGASNQIINMHTYSSCTTSGQAGLRINAPNNYVWHYEADTENVRGIYIESSGDGAVLTDIWIFGLIDAATYSAIKLVDVENVTIKGGTISSGNVSETGTSDRNSISTLNVSPDYIITVGANTKVVNSWNNTEYVLGQAIDYITSATPVWTSASTTWDTTPTSLANCIDGDYSTVTGTGYKNVSGAGVIGVIRWDLGASYQVNFRGKVGMWSNQSNLAVYVEYSNDNTTWYKCQIFGFYYSTSTTEIDYFFDQFLVARYVGLKWYANAALSGLGNCYEVQAIDAS